MRKKLSLFIILAIIATLLLTACSNQDMEKGQTDLTAADFKKYFENSDTHFNDLSKPVQMSVTIKNQSENEDDENYEYDGTLKFYDKIFSAQVDFGEGETKTSYTVYDFENMTVTTYFYDKDEEKWFKKISDKSDEDITEDELRSKLRSDIHQFSAFLALEEHFDMFELKNDKYYVKEDKLDTANELLWDGEDPGQDLKELWIKFNDDKISEFSCKYGKDDQTSDYSIKFSYENTVVTLPDEAKDAELED